MSEETSDLNLVCSEDIENEFVETGVKIDGHKVIEELKKLSIEYNLTPADLYAQWLSYTNKNPNVEVLDMVVVDELRSRIHQSKIKSTQHNQIKAKFVPKIKPKIEKDILATYISLKNIKVDPDIDDNSSLVNNGENESYDEEKIETVQIKQEPVDEDMEDVQIDKQIDNENEKFPVRYIKVERFEQPEQIEQKFTFDEDDHLFQKEVISEYGRQIPAKAWLTIKKDRNLNITPLDPSNHLSTDQKFMDSSIYKNVRAMDRIHEEMRELFYSCFDVTNGFIGDWSTLSNDEASYFGKIRMDAKDEFDEKVVFLHEDSSSKIRFQLDLTHAKEYSLFPGQFVEVKGEISGKDTIRVREVVDAKYLIRPFSLPSFVSPINIVTASGPFNSQNSAELTLLDGLLDYIVNYRPDVVFLFGPVIEMSQQMFNFNSSELFSQVMDKISEKITGLGTKVIVISSPKEWHILPTIPTPPYSGSWPGIEFHPSPSMIDINGLVVGLSSVDIALHLTKNLLESRYTGQESGTRIKRILHHLLVQQSFYPLYPPPEDTNLEITKLRYCRFSTTPHIMILPSMLRHFIWSVDNCVFINPERLRKNVIGRLQVFPSTTVSDNPVSQSLDRSIYAQIIRI